MARPFASEEQTAPIVGVLKWLYLPNYTFLHFQKLLTYRFAADGSQNHACLEVRLLKGASVRIQKFLVIFLYFLVTPNMLGRAVLIQEFKVSLTIF